MSMSIDNSSFTGSGESFFVLSSSNPGKRIYQNLDGLAATASMNISGAVEYDASLTTAEKRSILRLRSIYESNAFQKSDNFSSASVWGDKVALNITGAIVNVPQVLYGTRLLPSTIKIDDDGSIYEDDGLGGMYTGSVLAGTVFYDHGLIFFGSPFVPQSARTMLTASFSGSHEIPMNMYMCKAPRGEVNFSNNPSYTRYASGSNRNEITTKNPKTFITTVGLYDENYQLVGVAKVATPILNEEDSAVTFRLKLNF